MNDLFLWADMPARLLRLVGTAVVIVGTFAAAALVLSDGDALAPGPEAIAAGAAAAAVVLPRAQPHLARWVVRVTRRVRATPYDTVADVAGRLGAAVPTQDSISYVTDALRMGLGADRVEIKMGADRAARETLAPDYRVPISHADGRLAELMAG